MIDGAGFRKEFDDLCKRYNIDDHAIVVRTVAGDSVVKWDMGDFVDKDPVVIRQRIAGLFLDVSWLSKVIMEYSWGAATTPAPTREETSETPDEF